ncbi:MAG: hypothetical protein IPM69_04310 [Ignavibacteria bacterium]|nr:hypothetical protein [Ignavibacteria bacterium]
MVVPDSIGLIYAVSLNSDNEMALSCRKNFDKSGTLVFADHGEIMGTISTNVNPQQSEWCEITSNKDQILVTLNEGGFGSNNSILQLVSNLDSIPDNIQLGDGGNHIFYPANGYDYVFVTVTGSHKVVVVDLLKKKIMQTFTTNTSGYNGPRESVLLGKNLFVTTYNSSILEINSETGTLIATLNSKGKPEGLTVINGKLWVANAFGSGSYTPDSTVAIFESPSQ